MPPASDAREGGGRIALAAVKVRGVVALARSISCPTRPSFDSVADSATDVSGVRRPPAPAAVGARRRGVLRDRGGHAVGLVDLQHGQVGALVAGHDRGQLHLAVGAADPDLIGAAQRPCIDEQVALVVEHQAGGAVEPSPPSAVTRATDWSARSTGRVEVVALAGSSIVPISTPDSSRPTPPSTTPAAISVDRRRSARPGSPGRPRWGAATHGHSAALVRRARAVGARVVATGHGDDDTDRRGRRGRAPLGALVGRVRGSSLRCAR